MNTNKTLSIIATILGAIFMILAYIYWFTPANALPTFLPGYNAALAAPHFKHGLGAFIISLALFVFAWFKSAKKVS